MSTTELILGDWKYNLEARSYDLSRDSKTKLKLEVKDSRENNSVTIDPLSTALIIVDMQNVFLHPKCRDNPLGLKTVEPIVKAIENCRKLGIQVSIQMIE
jgi:isochorismate hydrolase